MLILFVIPCRLLSLPRHNLRYRPCSPPLLLTGPPLHHMCIEPFHPVELSSHLRGQTPIFDRCPKLERRRGECSYSRMPAYASARLSRCIAKPHRRRRPLVSLRTPAFTGLVRRKPTRRFSVFLLFRMPVVYFTRAQPVFSSPFNNKHPGNVINYHSFLYLLHHNGLNIIRSRKQANCPPYWGSCKMEYGIICPVLKRLHRCATIVGGASARCIYGRAEGEEVG